MTSIGSLSGISGIVPLAGAAADPRQAALGTIGEIGQRVLAWVSASGGSGDRAALAQSAASDGAGAGAGAGSDFAPDVRELSRGGDVYGLGAMTRDLASRFGATPAEEGGLRRSLEGFTREAVVQLAGLSGASPERQFAGIGDALAAAGGEGSGTGVAGVTERLDSATQVLARQNGS